MVAEGSVISSPKEPVGAAVNVAPDGFAHPVYRSGFALSLKLPAIVPNAATESAAETIDPPASEYDPPSSEEPSPEPTSESEAAEPIPEQSTPELITPEQSTEQEPAQEQPAEESNDEL